MTRPILLNGKFYSAQMTGVHRVAEELLRAMDSLLAEDERRNSSPMEILIPSNAQSVPDFSHIRAQSPGCMPWVWWEQFELPFRARDGLLVNLCNLGPLAARGCLTMIHDAQVYISPDSYSPAFVAWYKLALPALGRNSACVLTVSEYSRRMLEQYGVAPAAKIRVLHNGVDHILRTDADVNAAPGLGLEKRKFVLALSNTQAHKNIPLLMRAFEMLKDTGLKLVLIGGATRADFEAIDVIPPENVVFAGRIDDAKMRGLMQDALCFACPSLTEGFGLPPLEAMLVGCPAIAAPCGALPEVCGAAALYADGADSGAWAQAILRLDSDPAFRASLVAPGVAQARNFTWRKSAAQLLEIVAEFAPAAGTRKKAQGQQAIPA